ncbi:torsin-1A-interacting protein 2-like [Synchiropus picturatus]
MADLPRAVDHQDLEDTNRPVLMDAEEEVPQIAQKSMDLVCEEDMQEETQSKNPTHSDENKPTEGVAHPTESSFPQDDNGLLVHAVSDSLEDELEDQSIREPLIPEEPGPNVEVVSNEETNKPASISGDGNLEQVDGPESPVHEDSQDAFNDTEDPGEDERCTESEEVGLEFDHQLSSAPETYMGYRGPVEDIGPVTEETERIEEAGVIRGKRLLAALVLVFVAILIHHLVQPKPQEKKNLGRIDIFLREMERARTEFPHQRADLWTRSRIHLKRHLQSAQPSEPVSLILTAGLRARRTLRCLSRSLASAYSTAVNASVLHIDGASKAHTDSDTVKLDIDNQLQGAFEGDKPVAVIHRFEELPPGSTLIFYRYCDHENAAYKNTFLLFTVLLSEEEIPPKFSLSMVEEMVDDHLQKKFLTDRHPVSFDTMDLDKYGGLWSRISHLILPVTSEDRMEMAGC